MKKIILFAFLLVASLSWGQAWSGIISPSRAKDWSASGVIGDIPSASWSNCTTTACNTLFAGTVNAASIQAALASALPNTVVRIPAGTFSVGPFNFTQSNVALRGAGADQTKLTCTGGQSGGGLGGTNNPCIHLMSGATGVGSFGGVTSANWTAGFSQGTTVITLSSTTGLTAGPIGTGSIIMLNQMDDPADGWPAIGDIYACAFVSPNCSNQGGNNYGVNGRAVVQVVTVTAIGGGGAVTISPPIAYPNFRTGQSPQAYWVGQLSAVPIHNSGIENMTIDFTPVGTQGLYIINAANCWVLGNRFLSTSAGTQETYHIFMLQSSHITVRSNYVWGRPTTISPFPLANYAYSIQEVGDSLVENNIFDRNTEAMVPNDPSGGNVYSYNFVLNNAIGIGGVQMHSGWIAFDLFEGNDMRTFLGDVTHGTHDFETMFRGYFSGNTNNNGGTAGYGIADLTNNRFTNAVANVFNPSGYSQYEVTLSNANVSAEFNLGWQGNNSGTAVTNDTNVKRTIMRWGNWDPFASSNHTSTNDQTGVRYCGTSADTGWTNPSGCNSVTEIPSAITNFPSAIPTKGDTTIGMGAFPASFYLSAKPAWFGSTVYPPIGPDVTNGIIANVGGHANKIPSRVCYESLANDPVYGANNIKIFSASTCYAAGPPPSGPAPPTGLTAVVQ